MFRTTLIRSSRFGRRNYMKRQMLFLLVMLCMVIMSGCGDNKNRVITGSNLTPLPSKPETETETMLAGDDRKITAALISVDDSKGQIIVKDIYTGSNYVLTYNGGTDVKNVFKSVITMTQLAEGELVDVVFDEEKKKAKSVYVNEEAFRTNNVSGFKATSATYTITFGSASYMYTDNIIVISGGKILEPTEVMSRDVVTVRGIDNKIYSVSVDKGHGYLTFTGAEDFVGGMVEIGRSFLYTVSSDMMIVVPEGEYQVVMSNGKLDAKKTVYIAKDMTVTLDFGEFKSPATKTGTVEFQILPKDAELFIEGNKTDYSKPVVLDYGTYIINILSNDYPTYTGRIIVNSTYQVSVLDLSKIMTSGSKEDETTSTNAVTSAATTSPTTTAPTTTASTTTSSTETTASTTGSVRVTIGEPAGAGVYVNNVYVGTAPVTINKDPGEYVITFKKSGYITKSYIIDVDSSDGEQTFNFPAMSEE